MRYKRFAALVLAACALGFGACADTRPIKVSATSQTVAIQHRPDRRHEADRLAAATCAAYDRPARLRNRHDQYQTMDRFGIYDCVPR